MSIVTRRVLAGVMSIALALSMCPVLPAVANGGALPVAQAAEPDEVALADGTYKATKVSTDVTTDASGMIMVVDATVAIKDGKASAAVTMKGTGADRLYVSDTATKDTIVSEAVAEEQKEVGGEFGNLIGGLKLEGSSAYTFWPIPIELGVPKVYAARSASHFSKQDLTPDKYYYVHDFQIDAADLELVSEATELPFTQAQEAQRYLNQYFLDGKVTTSKTAASVKGKGDKVTVPYYDANGTKISSFVFKMAQSDKFRSGWFVEQSILNSTHFSSSNLKKIRYPEGSNGTVTFSPKAAYRDQGMTFKATLKLFPVGTGYNQYDAEGVFYDANPVAEQEFTFDISPLPEDRNVTIEVKDAVSKEAIQDAVVTVTKDDGTVLEPAEGVYTMSVPNAYTVTARADGYVVPGSEEAVLTQADYAPKKDGETLTLYLIKAEQAKVAVSFDVKDQLGEAVENPQISVYRWDDKSEMPAEPDGSFKVYNGIRYGYTITGEGYEDKTATFTYTEDGTESVVVNKYLSEQKFTFRVYDADTNETLEGVDLVVKYGQSGTDEAEWTVAEADADGIYTIPIDNQVKAYGSKLGYKDGDLGVWSLGFDPLKDCSFGLKLLPVDELVSVAATAADDAATATAEAATAAETATSAKAAMEEAAKVPGDAAVAAAEAYVEAANAAAEKAQAAAEAASKAQAVAAKAQEKAETDDQKAVAGAAAAKAEQAAATAADQVTAAEVAKAEAAQAVTETTKAAEEAKKAAEEQAKKAAEEKAAADKAAAAKPLAKGKKFTVAKNTYKVNGNKTVTLTKSKTSKKSLTVNTVKCKGIAYKVTQVGKQAFKGAKKLKKVTLGANVKKLASKAFKGAKKLKTLVVKSKKLTKKSAVKNCLKGSKVKTVKVKAAKKKTKKAFKKYAGKSKKCTVK